jgi:hypothetical protein
MDRAGPGHMEIRKQLEDICASLFPHTQQAATNLCEKTLAVVRPVIKQRDHMVEVADSKVTAHRKVNGQMLPSLIQLTRDKLGINRLNHEVLEFAKGADMHFCQQLGVRQCLSIEEERKH